MAWSGFREAAGESGLELSLGLPAYFTKPAAAAAAGLLRHIIFLLLFFTTWACSVLVGHVLCVVEVFHVLMDFPVAC
jgi:hypothetical protein